MIRRYIAAFGILITGFSGLLIVSSNQGVYAQASLVCDGLSPNQGGGDCTSAPSDAPAVDNVIEDALSLLSLIAGGVAVLMILIAGTKFITSQGDAGKVASARTTAMYAIIGLLIAAMAQTIIYFVLNNTINP